LVNLLFLQALCGKNGVSTVSKITRKWSQFKISGMSKPKTLGLSEMAANVRYMELVSQMRLLGVGL
jgi:hypothetical protein